MSGKNNFPFSAVIFDLDGTLVDSEDNYVASDGKILTSFGIEYTPELRRRIIGRGIDVFVGILINEHGVKMTPDELLAMKDKYYLDIARTNTRVFPEMQILLDKFKELDIPMAIASGSSQTTVEEIVKICGIQDYFSVLLSSVGLFPGKPEPDIFLETAKQLGVPPGKCLVLEDSPHGVKAAISARMKVVGIPTLTQPPLDPVFEEADLFYPQGMSTFKAADVLKHWFVGV